MSPPKIVSAEKWRSARVALLEDEKALTKARDRLNVKRRELPMVRIEKDYEFEGPDGLARLADLFDGRRQLIVSHFMFDDDVFHTYSSFGRGAEWTGGSYAYLDLTALGRQEEWEEPEGRADAARSATPGFAS